MRASARPDRAALPPRSSGLAPAADGSPTSYFGSTAAPGRRWRVARRFAGPSFVSMAGFGLQEARWSCRRDGAAGSRVRPLTARPHFGVAPASGSGPRIARRFGGTPQARRPQASACARRAADAPDVPELVLGSARLSPADLRVGRGHRIRSPGSPDGPTAHSPLLTGFGPPGARAAPPAFSNRRPVRPGQARALARTRRVTIRGVTLGFGGEPLVPTPASAGARARADPSRPQGWQVGATLALRRCASARRRAPADPSRRPTVRHPVELSRASARDAARRRLSRSTTDRPGTQRVRCFGTGRTARQPSCRPHGVLAVLPGGGASASLAAQTARRRPARACPGRHLRLRPAVPPRCLAVRRLGPDPAAPRSRFACPEVPFWWRDPARRLRRREGCRIESMPPERVGSEQRALPVSRGRFSSRVSNGKQ
jgi:hypothetical protein